MRAMKDSGIPWIGEIPEGWHTCQVKNIFTIARGRVIPITEMDDSYHYPVYSSQTKDNGCMGYIPTFDYEGEALTWTTDGANAGTVFYRVGKFNCTNICGVLQLKTRTSFITYMLYSVGHSAFHCRRADTNGYKIMSNEMAEIKIAVPPLAEQQAIAEFLDRKCAEVDEMIALQEQIVEELKAYNQSVITEAVTKGLNPNVPMRDSGIEWIGQIPEHWKIEPLKYNFNRRSERNNPIITTERLSLSIDKGVTLYSEKTTNLDRFKEDFTQYQLAYPNDIVLNCMNMIVGAVGLSKYLGCVSPVYYVIYPSNCKVDSEYYSYMLNTPTIRGVYYSYGKGIYAIERGEGRVNTCRLKVSYDDFGRLDIPIPPIEEQKNIVSYIKEKCANIDSLIQTKQSKINSLKEYKKSIIYEYVTGKREVNE